jgi:hypothetical protein
LPEVLYKQLLGVENDCNDGVHQAIIADETMLTIYNDGTYKNNLNQNRCNKYVLILPG